jgi:hypothetical protein
MTFAPRTWTVLVVAALAMAFAGCGGEAFSAAGAGGAGGTGAGTAVTATSTSTCAGADCSAVTATTATSTTTSGQGGAGGSAGSGGGSGEGGSPSVAEGIALLVSELPGGGGSSSAVSTGSSGSSSSAVTTSGGSDSDGLLVVLGAPLDCGKPGAVDCGDQWSFVMHLSPMLQQPGTYTLEEVNAQMSETSGPAGNCSFGSGPMWDGLVEIESVSLTKVVGTVYTNSLGGWSHDPAGPFVAPRCF